jgi:serine phosphatase RsbU (regulator of sigma subunit)
VPGAFMTMIAHSILNEVVIEQKITNPDEILNQLHSLIFKALKQHKGDEYSQDGMDLSFVKIDHQYKMLTFAGARNNAFVVYNTQVETLKATQKSIGGLSLLGEAEPERKFKSETFQIKENSTLILTTDGIFDQLNDEDKKFGTNRFKEMILKLNTNTVAENVPFLEETFTNWKKSVAQLDDILLVGLRV